MPLPSLSQHQLLVMWAQLLVVVVVARALGGVMRRFGQPPIVGELLLTSPVPLVIVRRASASKGSVPQAFARAVVPVSGTPSSRVAEELAFNLSRELGTEVVITHVVNRPRPDGPARSDGFARPAGPARPDGLARSDGLAQQSMALAEKTGARGRAMVRSGLSTAEQVLATAEESGADLIILGASVRRVGDRPFLGQTVEQVLGEATTSARAASSASSVVIRPSSTASSSRSLSAPMSSARSRRKCRPR
ncbi:MAG: universal stress protein [Acidimicrobiales bacterium]